MAALHSNLLGEPKERVRKICKLRHRIQQFVQQPRVEIVALERTQRIRVEANGSIESGQSLAELPDKEQQKLRISAAEVQQLLTSNPQGIERPSARAQWQYAAFA